LTNVGLQYDFILRPQLSHRRIGDAIGPVKRAETPATAAAGRKLGTHGDCDLQAIEITEQTGRSWLTGI
jgi:hypothetical protein